MLGAPGGVVSMATVRVDVAVISVDVAAENATAVVPSERINVKLQFPSASVVVVDRELSKAAVTVERTDVEPINVTLVVAYVAFSSGERTARERGGVEAAGVETAGVESD